MTILFVLLGVVSAILVAGLVLRIANPLPPITPRSLSAAITDTEDTRLGRALADLEAAHPGLSGILPLADPREAFAARVVLIRAADRAIDLQYYIWRGDISGTMLFEELRRAADRGVRVRLLLDDNGTGGIDEMIAALDTHPMIEVRLFNPFTIRRPKPVGYLMDFLRLNRRMHNKSLTADAQATIIGGRNIGDEYFGASATALFADLDVLATGAIVPEMAADFDRYWSSGSAYPARVILPAVGADRLLAIAEAAACTMRDPLAVAYHHSVVESVITPALAGGRLPYEWVKVAMVSDDPAKALGRVRRHAMVVDRLVKIIGASRHTLGLVSAYFVPTRSGARFFAQMARSGVKVTILTNALNATDVALVHAGYARYRHRLLKAGVVLWELKGKARTDLKLVAPGSKGGGVGTVFRASGSSLHAKTFSSDRDRLYVGSFNFDPRSVELNTELGFLIESRSLAGRLQSMLDTDLAASAYRVVLAPGGRRLNWIEQGDGGTIIHKREPRTGPLQRAIIVGLSLLPIEWLL